MRRVLAAVFAIFALVTAAAAQDRPNTILVLDGSGSMWGQIDGVNKIVIARDVVGTILDDFPADENLGLTVYGHRTRGDCSDIETVVPPGPGTIEAIRDAVNGINPRGKTPMTDAVIAAAEALRYTEERATVILVSDGIETCNPDPCAAARALEEAGIDFTVHVVGFDVTDPAALAQMECLAAETGGTFTTAANADELTDALQTVVAEPEPVPQTVRLVAVTEPGGPEIDEAVTWTVVQDGTPLTEGTGPTWSTALDAGAYEARGIRVSDAATGATSFTVAADTADAGQRVEVIFPEPAPPLTTVTFRAVIGDEDGPLITDPVVWTLTTDDGASDLPEMANPVEVELPQGSHLIEAYWTVQEIAEGSQFVVMTDPRTVTLVFEEPLPSARIVAPASAPLGAVVQVGWDGPGAEGDYLEIGLPGENYDNYVYTRDGNPVELLMPPATGTYEIRYIRGDDRAVLASIPIEITPIEVAVTGPASAPLAAMVEIGWTGPDYRNDYIAISRPDEDGYVNYAYTRDGNPLMLEMPSEPGDYELRYILDQDRMIMATAPITVEEVQTSVTAAETAPRGASIPVEWTGPGTDNDYIAVSVPGEDGYVNYAYIREGNPVMLEMPATPGDYEIRYILDQDREVLATTPITVTDIPVSVSAPAEAVAGATVMVDWVGPDYDSDYITVSEPGDDGYVNYTYTREGTPLELLMPTEPGTYEIRYVLNQDREIAATTTITVTELKATLDAPAEGVAGATIAVAWEGPDYDSDYLAVSEPGDDGYVNYTYTRDGNPAELVLPPTPGTYELRYVLNQDRAIIARREIAVGPVKAQLVHEPTGAAGGDLIVGWDGPDYQSDYITVSRVGDDGYETYEYTRSGNPVTLNLPDEPGTYEVRYVMNQDRTVIATSPLTVE